jgi:hypothetical protein
MRLSVGLINSEVSWNQPGELTEQVSSKNLDQQMQLTEVKMDDLLMIGGIGIFLPCAQEEAEICVADGATAEQSQLTMTVKRRIGADFETAQADEGRMSSSETRSQEAESVEHSEECLNIFSQGAEKL